MRAAPSSSCEGRRGAGGEEDRVAGLGADRVGQAGQVRLGEVLGHRAARLAGLRVEHDVGQAAGAARLGPVLPAVELLAGLRRAAGHDDRADVFGLEHAELGALEVGGQLVQLDGVAQVGLVGAVAVHRVVVGDARQRRRQLVAGQLAPQRADDRLAELDDVVLGHEGHLDVELGELGLAVGAEVLVAVAARDLVVALHAGHHQQLLEQLGRLRQRVPGAGLKPNGDKEVARALGRRPGQRRGLDLEELALAQHLAGDGVGPRAQPDRLGLVVAAQVKVAVAQARLLADGDVLVDREGQRRGLGKHLKVGDGDLDRAGGQLGVLVALRPRARRCR